LIYFLDKNDTNLSFWDIKIVGLKEDVESLTFYENYSTYYNRNINNSETEEFIDRIYANIEFTSSLSLLLLQPELKFIHK